MSPIDRSLIGDETDTPDHGLDYKLKLFLDGDKRVIRELAKFYRPELTPVQQDQIADRIADANLLALLKHAEADPTCANCFKNYPYDETVRWPTLCRGCAERRFKKHGRVETFAESEEVA